MDSSFQQDSAISANMGLEKRRQLKPDAIPTLFDRPAARLPSSSAASASCSRKRGSSTVSLTDHNAPRQPKKRRGAYEKRQRSRVSREFIDRHYHCNSLYMPVYLIGCNRATFSF